MNNAGEACSTKEFLVTGNEALGVLSGVNIFCDDALKEDCIILHDFRVTRASQFGIFYQGEPNLRVTDSLMVDTGVGILPMVTQPLSKLHKRNDKVYVYIFCYILVKMPHNRGIFYLAACTLIM